MSHKGHTEGIEACPACVQVCEHCACANLHEEEPKVSIRCIELARSCADLADGLREMVRGLP